MNARIFVLLFFAGIASAQCTKPVITATTGTSDATGQQLTLTWTTSVAADSMAVYGYLNAGTATAVTDAAGVTSHTVVITGLVPGRAYQWGVRSQAINGGVGCGTGFIAYDGAANLTHSTTMTAAPAGSFTYGMAIVGGSYVTQGFGVYLKADLWALTGTYSTTGIQILITGLPTGTTVNWSGANNNGGIFPIENDTQSATNVNFDTVAVQHFNFNPQEAYILTSGSTPVGNYTLTFTASAINASGYPTVVATAPLNVVSSTAPFSGTVLTAGNPSSYPTIPDVPTFLSSASLYGQQSCAQDLDTTPRTIRVNDQANLVQPATCCTFDSWFYDGVQVYYNVETLLTNTQYTGQSWSTCRSNVKQVYRDNYALAGTIETFMTFSTGYLNDYLKTHDSQDIALVNQLNTNDNTVPYHASMVDVDYLQRETVYSMRNLMDGVLLGQTPGGFGNLTAVGMRDYAKEHVLGQIDQLCLTKNAQYWESFMMGLQAMVLIDYYNLVSQDKRIPPAIACLATWMKNTLWEKIDTGSFPYDKYQLLMGRSIANGSTDCLNTLNNMSSPMYAWLFQYTGNAQWQQWGDPIWDHGVLFDCSPLPTGPSAYLTMRSNSDGKNYSQNYEWGTNYVIWRSPVSCPTH